MGDTLATFAFGVTFKKLTDLEKQHDEDRFGELGFGPWQETNAKCSNGGNRHEEMFVESLAMSQSLGSFLQCVEADEQIRNQINDE